MHDKLNKKQPITFRDLLLDMDDSEEQRTIIGFGSYAFKQGVFVNPKDVICENAFLMALGLPVRVDHHSAINTFDDGEAPASYDMYYTWLESQFTYISQIPEQIKDNKELVLEFLKKYPAAAKTLSDNMRNDVSFMWKLVRSQNELISYFPELTKNQDFMLKTIQTDTMWFFKSDKQLLESKNFVLKALDAMNTVDRIFEAKSIISVLDETLQQDANILKKFESPTTMLCANF